VWERTASRHARNTWAERHIGGFAMKSEPRPQACIMLSFARCSARAVSTKCELRPLPAHFGISTRANEHQLDSQVAVCVGHGFSVKRDTTPHLQVLFPAPV
jgi:hypothetical protein